MSKKIIIGIIGFGKIGRLRYKILSKNIKVKIVKIYDPKFIDKQGIFCSNFSEIINSKLINTVFICTQTI